MAPRKRPNTSTLLGFAVLAVAAVIALVVVQQRDRPPQDCSFSGWKNSLGIELETQVRELDAVKGKLGITDAQIRDFDDAMRDYALKYNTACQGLHCAAAAHQPGGI